MPAHDTTAAALRLIVTPERPALPAGAPATLHVLVRVQAPEAAGAAPREPLGLALVLDRSGSMAGRPLAEARRCAKQMIDRLAHDDRAALVVYDDEVACIAPLAPAGDKQALHAALDTVVPGGSTDLCGGWRAGADALCQGMAAAGVHRVILLSDGCANAGVTDLETITGACRDLARRGVSTSTYGLGEDFNETLMLAMAQAGRGSAYYGATAEDLAEPFLAEFELLSRLCARGLVLRVHAPEGVQARLCNDYEAADGALAWKLPDLAYASEAWAVLAFDVPQGWAAPGASADLAITVSVEAGARDAPPLFLMAALPPLRAVSPEACDALPRDPLVATRLAELEAAGVLAGVRALVAAGRWDEAERSIGAARVRFAAYAWAGAVLETLERLVAQRRAAQSSKEALYASASMSRRLAPQDEARFAAADEADVPAFLRRKTQQGRGRPLP